MKALVLQVDDGGITPVPSALPIVIATGNDAFLGLVKTALNATLGDIAAHTATTGADVLLQCELVEIEGAVLPGDGLELVSGLYKKHVTP